MKIVNVLLLTLLATAITVVWADNNMPHSSNMPGMHQGSTTMNMQDIHNHFRDMEKTMDQIRNTKNNKEVWKLMDKHMQEMQTSMSSMGPMMNMMGNHMGNMSSDQMMNNINMMDQRMDMLQQMMQHMMDQQSIILHQRGMMK